jgi:transposase
VWLVTVLAWSGPDQAGHVEGRARSQRDAHAGRPRRARPSGSTPTDTHTAAVVQAASGAVVDQLTVPATPAGYRRPSARRPIRRLAGVGDREPRRRWRRPDPVPAGSGRAGGGAGPAKRAARRHGAKSDPWSDQGGPRAWAATASPSPEQPVTGRRCRCGWPPGVRRSRRPPTPTPAPRARVAARDPLRGRLGNLTTPRLVATCGRLRQQATGMSRPPPHGRDLGELGPPHPPPEPRGRRPHPGQQRLGPGLANRTCSAAAGGPDRGRHRVVRLVPSWPLRKRRRLRHAGRGRPDPGLQRPDGAVRLNRSGDRQLNQALHLVVLTGCAMTRRRRPTARGPGQDQP